MKIQLIFLILPFTGNINPIDTRSCVWHVCCLLPQALIDSVLRQCARRVARTSAQRDFSTNGRFVPLEPKKLQRTRGLEQLQTHTRRTNS